jgi:hypothetical protein
MPKKEKGYSSFHLHAKRNAKRKDAEARQAKYDSLTIAEKFTTLIEGGSSRQRAKLQKQLDATVTVEPTKPKNKSVKKK